MDSEKVSGDRGALLYSLDEALAAIGFGRFGALALVYAGIGSMAVAMQVMILSFIGPSFAAEWKLSSAQESLVTTALFGGMLVGDCLWGVISDNNGRRMGFLSMVVTSIFTFLSLASPNYVSLLLARAVVGIGLGGGPVYSTWFLEFMPVHNRGVWMVIFSVFWTIGTIFEDLLAWIIIPGMGWRWLLAISSAPCFLTLILNFFTMESPRYLCLKGNFGDLHDVLTKMAAINKITLPPNMIVSGFIASNEEWHSESTRNLSNSIAKTFSSIPSLFSTSLAKTTLVAWALFFGNSFLYYGIILMTSELSSGRSRCWSNAPSLTQANSSLYKSVFITSLAELPGLLLSAALVDSIGRRLSLVLMYSITFVLLFPLMISQHELLMTCLLFGARLCITGTFTVAGVCCSEIYPTSVRTTGLGVANAVGRIGAMLCPIVGVGMVSGCHQTAAVASLEVIALFVGICVLFLAVETKGRRLADTVTLNS